MQTLSRRVHPKNGATISKSEMPKKEGNDVIIAVIIAFLCSFFCRPTDPFFCWKVPVKQNIKIGMAQVWIIEERSLKVMEMQEPQEYAQT